MPFNNGGYYNYTALLYNAGQTTGVKTMEDVRGKMSEVWFDLYGRKLNGKPTQKGIYIHDEKAVVVSD
jgi:hypothetical protein